MGGHLCTIAYDLLTGSSLNVYTVILARRRRAAAMTRQQQRSLLELLRFWANEYHITIPRKRPAEFDAVEDLQ